MRNLFTNQSLAGMTYNVLSMTTKNGGKFPLGIYNLGCKLPIIPRCYSDINMTVLFNHNTIDNTGNVPVNVKYFTINKVLKMI